MKETKINMVACMKKNGMSNIITFCTFFWSVYVHGYITARYTGNVTSHYREHGVCVCLVHDRKL